MIIVSVCFVGMMVFAWGMDITGRRSRIQTGIIGEVNGQKISYELYSTLIQNRRKSLGENQRSDYMTERRIHTEVWEELVNQALISQEIRKRKISFSNRELLSYILFNPPQVASQISLFQDNGQFSFSKYQEFIRNPDNYKNPQTASLMQYIENQAKMTLPFLKFQQLLTGGVLVPDAMVHDRWLKENEKRTIQWLFLTPARFPDIAKSPEQQDLESYYNEHKKDYEHKELRVLDVVFFELATTPPDSADVLERAQTLVQRAKSGENFADLANGYTEDPGNEDAQGNRQGGSLGWFGRNSMVKQFEDIAFGLKPGEVSAPFLTRFGYHIVKVDSVKYKEDAKGKPTQEVDQINARHILLKIEPSARTRELMENNVKSFYDEVSKNKDFNQCAQEKGLTVNRTQAFDSEATYISFIGPYSDLLVKRVFHSKKGEVLPVYYTDQGTYVMKVAEIVPAGIPPLEDIIQRVTADFQRGKRLDYAEEVVDKIYHRIQSGTSLKEAAEADSSLKVNVQASTITQTENVPGLGSMNSLVAAAFSLTKVGESTGPVRTELGAGIAVYQEQPPLDEGKYQSEREDLRSQIMREIQNQVLTRAVEDLRKKAKIVDNRYMYYNL
jgi:peptidyl-prolyl cis-trans isomerase D